VGPHSSAPLGGRVERRGLELFKTINSGESRDDPFGRGKDEQLGHRSRATVWWREP